MNTQEVLDREWFERVIATGAKNEQDATELKAEIERVGRWYDETPSVINESTLGMYKAFSEECARQANRMMMKYHVFVNLVTGQPYETLAEMSADIRQGTLKITTDNSNHPAMSLYETADLRVWHDLTHYELQTNFGYRGEYQTYLGQVEHVKNSPHADVLKHILYCDIVGQVGNGLIHRVFPEQKLFELHHTKGML